MFPTTVMVGPTLHLSSEMEEKRKKEEAVAEGRKRKAPQVR